ncbi:TetR/AcrR family transcriptional regulator [Nocardia terpenica]|uniref:TetR/AcrR family transcriptional regulator n=1 Tax=Nocardia terpenica TaxID=455432 RepID=UPI0019321DB3|nr:TetR/AcrR family transcriptional regulator [Nocardia terpenica]
MPAARGRPRTGVREAVIATAQQVLTESGVARLSTREVAARAGVAESSIFYHFGDRMGLLHAVIQQHLRPLQDMLADHRTPVVDLRAELLALVQTLEEFFVAAIPVMAAILSDTDLRARHETRSRDLDLGPHRAVDAVLAHLSPRLPAPVPRPAALLLVGAAHQRALQRRLSPPEALTVLPTAAEIVDAALPLFRP